MQTEIKIEIPKSLYEDKSSVTPRELLWMITDLVERTEKMEADYKYELETEFKAIHENARLKERINQLEKELKNKGE